MSRTLLLVCAVFFLSACSSSTQEEEESASSSSYGQRGTSAEWAELPKAVAEGEPDYVSFGDGPRNTQVSGELSGIETNTYWVKVREGETLQLEMASGSEDVFFSIQYAGRNVFDTGMRQFDGELEGSGDYLLRVYRDPNSVHGEGPSRYVLDVGIE